MKKFTTIISVLFFMSCGNNSSSDKSVEAGSVKAEEPAKTEDPEVTKGMQLIANSDCLTCHTLTEAKIGPPYADVSEKYKSNPSKLDYLAQKIIKGGSGVWGTVPMAAHIGMSEQDAKSMATYIMSIKK